MGVNHGFRLKSGVYETKKFLLSPHYGSPEGSRAGLNKNQLGRRPFHQSLSWTHPKGYA